MPLVIIMPKFEVIW